MASRGNRALVAISVALVILALAACDGAQAQVVDSLTHSASSVSASSSHPSSTSSSASKTSSSGTSSASASSAAATSSPNLDRTVALLLLAAFGAVLVLFALFALPRRVARVVWSLKGGESGWVLKAAKAAGGSSAYAYEEGKYEGASGVRRPAPARSVSRGAGGKLQRQNTNATLVNSSSGHHSDKWFGGASEQSHTLAASHAPSSYAKSYGGKPGLARGKSSLSGSGPGYASSPAASSSSQGPPAHIPSPTSLLHPLSSPFSLPITPTLSLGQLILLVAYAAGVLVAVFIRSSVKEGGEGGPLKDAERLGWIASAQLPVVVALGVKNGVVGWAIGWGYERLNYFHRWAGTVAIFCVNWHGLGYFYKWALAGTTATELATPANQAGLTGLALFDLLALMSVPWVRRRCYALFYSTHILAGLGAFTAIGYHKPGLKPFLYAALALYALDHVLRLLKTRVVTARVRALPALQSTRVTIPAGVIGKGWRPGQHVRVRVLCADLGWKGWAAGLVGAHPFTIASAPAPAPSLESDASFAYGYSAEYGGGGGEGDVGGRGLELIVKKAGTWTGALYDLAGRAGYYAGDDAYCEEREVRMIVEGPYGGLGNMLVPSYAGAVLVVGGSGVTFALGVLEEAVLSIRAGRAALRYVEMVWSVPDRDAVNPLLPTFSALLGSIKGAGTTRQGAPSVVLKISVFYSRAPSSKPRSSPSPEKDSDDFDSASAYLSALAPLGLTLSSGRPPLAKILGAAATFVGNLPPEHARGVAVASCGPVELVADVRKAVGGVNGEVRDACGGVEVHEEMFGF